MLAVNNASSACCASSAGAITYSISAINASSEQEGTSW